MTLLEKIDLDVKTALKSKNELRVTVVRMLKSELKYKQIDLGRDLTTEDEIVVVSSAAKKRSEAIEEYGRAGRDDLVRQESAEYDILKEYLPQQLSDDELAGAVMEAVAETDASSMKDFGVVMKALMPRTRGRADGKVVSSAVKAKLSSL